MINKNRWKKFSVKDYSSVVGRKRQNRARVLVERKQNQYLDRLVGGRRRVVRRENVKHGVYSLFLSFSLLFIRQRLTTKDLTSALTCISIILPLDSACSTCARPSLSIPAP